MTKVLLTGLPGCGKTTTAQFLAERGFTTFNTDDVIGATRLQNISTGEAVDWPDHEVDWSKFAWNWQRPIIKELLAKDDFVVLSGVVSNQAEFYNLFDHVYVMTISPETRRRRLEQHEHKSHHLPGVIDRKVATHNEKQAAMLARPGVEELQSNGSTIEIARDLLGRCGIEVSF